MAGPNFLELIDRDDRQGIYLLGRPMWGPNLYGPDALMTYRNEIVEELTSLQEEGGLLILPFAEEAEKTTLLFLTLLAGMLDQRHWPFSYTQYIDIPYLEAPEGHKNIWIIHQAPRFKNLFLIMESWVKEGRAILATGTPVMWERYPLKVSSRWINYFMDKDISFKREEVEALSQAQEKIKQNALQKSAYHLTALCDGWGVPLPFDLLSRMIDKDEGGDNLATAIEEAYEKEILYWIEREKPPALLVSTRSEGLGRRYLYDLAKAEKLSLDDYQPILSAIDPEEQEERFTALKLFQSWLADSRLRIEELSKEKFGIKQIREWILKNWELVQKIALTGSASEVLVWGQCLHHLGLYIQALNLLAVGLKNSPKNPYLLQAKAHLLSKWGGTEPEKQKEAFQAFSEAVKIVKNNPYLWQSWGVFEAERGNRRDAEMCFIEALNIDPKSICTLTARADMYLEAGLFDQAKVDLEKARKINPENVYFKHITGRWHFYLGGTGAWDEAIKEWDEILRKDKRNLYALQSLGHLFRERREWEKATENIKKALSIDPENVPALLERCQLESEQKKYQEAKSCIDQALEVDPENLKCLVTLAGVERSLGQVDLAIARLEDLIQKWPDNLYIRHLLAHCYYFDQGQKESALTQLQTIINLTHGRNFPAYTTWAEMAYHEKQREEAENLLNQAESIYHFMSAQWPAHQKINALLEMARLFRLFGNSDKMRTCLNKASEIDKENKKILNF